MSQHAAGAASERHVRSLKVWWLIVGRVCASALLIVVSASWSPEWAARDSNLLPGGFVPLIAGVGLLSVLYTLLHVFSSRLALQIRIQLTLDALLISWLVWMTDDVRSPYVALYMVVIALAGWYLGARDAMVAAIGCGVCYTALTLSVALGLLPPYGAAAANPALVADSIQKIGLNDIAFLVVGLLAARLAAERAKSDVQLIAATHALANLRALHERIIESMRSGVITTDLHGRIYSVNTAAEEITGYQARDLKGRLISRLFERIDELVETSRRASAAGQNISRAETECFKPDGTRLHLGLSIVPLTAESGETTGLVLTFQDLTQIRALEEQSRRQDRLAAIGRVSAGIAHEIRNPLAAMRGSVQMLRADMNGDPHSAELMEIVLRESDRLNRIITDFLLYARPRPCELSVSDLREPLREVITLLRNSHETHKGHTFVEHLPDAPLLARFDSAQLRQVFWNLTRNALQAMPGGGTLTVGLARLRGGDVQIIFADTGCGIPAEQQEKLFEPFSSSKTNGTGLGLSIVYQIVQDHGGRIGVRSIVGKGTTITVELPGGAAARAGADRHSAEEMATLYG